MPLRPRPEVEKLAPAAHGGPDEAEFRKAGLNGGEIIDFSVCSNPYMHAPMMNEIIQEVAIDRLPDSEATEFRERLGGKLSVSPANILAGNGAMEPIRLIALAYFGRGDSVIIPEPTFGEYRVACQISGAEITGQWGKERDNFNHNIEKIADLIKKSRPRGVFICNPNNPSGSYLSRQQITDILDACPETLVVIDEAYISFVADSWSSLDLIERDNLIIVRSMTKDFALAGLRLGYAVAHQDIIDVLGRVRPPWSVNALAQQAGIAVLKDYDRLETAGREILKAKQFLVDEFSGLGFSLVPSRTHFFLMKVTRPGDFRTALLKQGLLVRDCASFGLPEYVRIAARTLPECRQLVNAVKEMKEW
ncbi:MAG: histidinol-phosphate transaminase [Dehalococcoidales bacterium]